MIPCSELNQTKAYLLQQFKNCKTLKAEDMQLFVNYVSSIGLCVETDGGGFVDLSYIPAEDQGTIANTAGTDAIIPLADETNAGLLSPQEKESIASAIQPGDNISELNNDSNFISSVDWDEIGGDQSTVNLSGFNNDSEFITLNDIPSQYFTYEQTTPSDKWTFEHPLDRKVSVTITDSAGTVMEGQVTLNTGTEVEIQFNVSFWGYAYLI